MPRYFLAGKDKTIFEETYPVLFKNEFQDIYGVEILSYIGLDSEEVLYLSKFVLESRALDFIVFHFGVNDCAPRIFPKPV